MEQTGKLHPGQAFPPLTFKRIDGADYSFGGPGAWQALFVIRGQHCPLCKIYLTRLEENRAAFEKLGVSIAAVSADSEAQTRITIEASKPGFPMLYGLDVATMTRLGLYISEPRSPQETDHVFAEPALLVVNPAGTLQIVEIANSPAMRPALDLLLRGLGVTIERGLPVRGTYR